MMGAPASRSGSRPTGGAAGASPAKPSIPSAVDAVLDILERNLPFPRRDMAFIAATIVDTLEAR